VKIALISEHASPLAALGGADAGGQNVYVAALARSLVERGHEVVVFTRRDSATLPPRVAVHGYLVEHLAAGPPVPIPKDDLLPHIPELTENLFGRLCQGGFDVVHAHFWMSGLAATAAARRLGLPVVQTFHALGTVKRRHQGAKDTSPLDRIALERRLCTELDHVVATCADEVTELRRLGLPAERVTVVPCGVDTELFRPRPTPRLDDTLLVVGRLVERKGVADIVAALAAVPDARLLIAGGPTREELGEDPEVHRLAGIAREHDVADRVRFLGAVRQHEVARLMAASSAVVCAPWYEPFGIVPVEAMAAGRPVVGTAVGGLLDTVDGGVTGDLVPPRNPHQLGETMRRLLADPERREAYGLAGRAKAVRRYRWPRIAAGVEQVYLAQVRRTGNPVVAAAGVGS